MPIDPNDLDIESLTEAADADNEYLESIDQKKQARDAAVANKLAEEGQVKSELDDPRNAEEWGFKALVKEGQSILAGGAQDTASSLATFPERTVDALSGEMQREKKEKGFYMP